jgi:hypothetical protein
VLLLNARPFICFFSPLSTRAPAQVPSLVVSVAGKAPFHLFESFAITQYLAVAEGKGSGMAPRSSEELAEMTQWSLWAITETEPVSRFVAMVMTLWSLVAMVMTLWSLRCHGDDPVVVPSFSILETSHYDMATAPCHAVLR